MELVIQSNGEAMSATAEEDDDVMNLFKDGKCIGWIHITEDGRLDVTLWARQFNSINIYGK